MFTTIDTTNCQPEGQWISLICPNCQTLFIAARPASDATAPQRADFIFHNCAFCGLCLEAR